MKPSLKHRLFARGSSPPVFIWVPALGIIVLLLISPTYLTLRSLGAGSEGLELLLRPRIAEILFRTLLLVTSVTTATIIIAVPLAWLQIRTDLKAGKFWRITTSLPLVIPTYVGGFVLVVEFGSKGALHSILGPLFGVKTMPDISGFLGAFLLLSILSFPYVLLPVRGALSRIDNSLEEASRNLGYSQFRTFIQLTLPLLRPSITSGALLVALYTLSDFGAVSLLRYETFTWAIFSQYEGALNRYLGALLSLVLMLLALSIVIVEGCLRGRGKYYRSDGGGERPPSLVKLGGWQIFAQLYSGAICFLGLVVPCSVLIYWVAREIFTDRLEYINLLGLAWNSLAISLAAALVTILSALPIAILSVRYPSMLSYILEKITYVGFALPGIAVALGLVFFGSQYMGWFYQSFWILIAGYLVLFLPAAVGAMRTSLLQVQPGLEYAGRSLGREAFSVMRSITLPLMRPGIFAGGALVFLLTMKELPATLILSPLGFETLATEVWSASSEALFARAAAPALILILSAAIPLILVTMKDQLKI